MDRTLNIALIVIIIIQGVLGGWFFFQNSKDISANLAASLERVAAQEARMNRFADFAIRTQATINQLTEHIGVIDGRLQDRK